MSAPADDHHSVIRTTEVGTRWNGASWLAPLRKNQRICQKCGAAVRWTYERGDVKTTRTSTGHLPR
jgi:hypothetical protein